MDPGRVQQSLRLIGKTYKEILDGTAKQVLMEAENSVGPSKEHYDYTVKNQSRLGVQSIRPWGYTINHDAPLCFKPSKALRGIDLRVDVYCDIRWTDDNDRPVTQDIKVRLWSQHNPTIFDESRDAKAIEEKLADPTRRHYGRVVARFHLDKADPDQKKGPKYHFQVGGHAEEYELCWHPKSIDIPRMVYQPMELFLTCQVIAANFFWDEYLEIREKSEWRQELQMYQKYLLESYFGECLKTLQAGESLLDRLWVGI